jgi:FkbM family methyltransferase
MIRLRTSGHAKPGKPIRWLAEASTLCSSWLAVEVEVPSPTGALRFRCQNSQALRRAYTLFIKEPGTITWLNEQLQDGDVLLDVGANVGIYTLYAALRVGPRGHVFAVEPHLRNAVALLENVYANGFQERVTVLTIALCDAPTIARFDYREWRTGSSRSRLDIAAHTPASGGELKLGQSIDALVSSGAIRAPDLIKVDVDGLEPQVVRGMTTLLTRPIRPRSVQIECDLANHAEIEQTMTQCGYRLGLRHASMAGAKRLQAGIDIVATTHNAIFAPATQQSISATGVARHVDQPTDALDDPL